MKNERMIKLYASMVREGKKTIDEVPTSLRDAVQNLLDEDVEE